MKEDLKQSRCQASPSLACSRLSECVASVRKYNEWRRGKIDWEDLEPEDVGKFLDEICDRADEAEMKLKTIAKKSRAALQTSWLYSGKEHVEKLMREIAEISSENDQLSGRYGGEDARNQK